MTGLGIPDYHRIRFVRSFAELTAARFTDGVNALCWPRSLPGDFGQVVKLLGVGEEIITLDEASLNGLRPEAGGKAAVDVMLADHRLLQDLGHDPVLNCIHGYPRDDEPGPVVTDVFSFHADSAPVEADTWLCTYHGAPSEGLRNEEAQRKVDDPTIRAELLKAYGGPDDAGFADFLHEHCYDLHYAAQPGAVPWSFGVGNLWRIAIDHPGNRAPHAQASGPKSQVSPSPPCIHRAPETLPGGARLLLIA